MSSSDSSGRLKVQRPRCANQPFSVSTIAVGSQNIIVSYDKKGNMLLGDENVGVVKLSDLVGGGGITDNTVIQVEIADWFAVVQPQTGQDMWQLEIPHLLEADAYLLVPTFYKTNFEIIRSFDRVQMSAEEISVRSIKRLEMIITVKL